MSVHDLKTAVRQERILAEALRRRFPELEEDEQAFFDTLDGISDFDKQVEATLLSAEADKVLAAAARERVAAIEARARRYEASAEKKRDAVLEAVQETGRAGKPLRLPEFTVSVRQNPRSVVVTDVAKIPADFIKPPPPPEPKKAELGAWLKAGNQCDGAFLSNGGYSLGVRRS